MSFWKKISKKKWFKPYRDCCGSFLKEGAGEGCKDCEVPMKLQEAIIEIRRQKKKEKKRKEKKRKKD